MGEATLWGVIATRTTASRLELARAHRSSWACIGFDCKLPPFFGPQASPLKSQVFWNPVMYAAWGSRRIECSITGRWESRQQRGTCRMFRSSSSNARSAAPMPSLNPQWKRCQSGPAISTPTTVSVGGAPTYQVTIRPARRRGARHAPSSPLFTQHTDQILEGGFVASFHTSSILQTARVCVSAFDSTCGSPGESFQRLSDGRHPHVNSGDSPRFTLNPYSARMMEEEVVPLHSAALGYASINHWHPPANPTVSPSSWIRLRSIDLGTCAENM